MSNATQTEQVLAALAAGKDVETIIKSTGIPAARVKGIAKVDKEARARIAGEKPVVGGAGYEHYVEARIRVLKGEPKRAAKAPAPMPTKDKAPAKKAPSSTGKPAPTTMAKRTADDEAESKTAHERIFGDAPGEGASNGKVTSAV